MYLRTNVPFQYTISGDREQVFLLYYKDFFEQICSDVQLISPPEEVGEFLLHLLKKNLEGISQKVLTDSLRSMENDGLIIRTVYPEVPPRVEYSLSQLGLTLKPILDSMVEWGNAYKKL